MEPVRVLIADDEPPARARLRRLLAADPRVELAGEAASGTEAVELIERLRPELVFLDIQMPGADGFGVLQAVDPAVLPHVVFVTAYDEYALRAFEVHAVDYLLKPFDADRFRTALARAMERVRARTPAGADAGLEERIRRVLAEARPAPAYLERVLVRAGTRAVFLRVDEVDWLQAEENYVRLHAGRESYLVRGTLAGLEERLDPARFIRVHRSHIVNVASIRELHPWSHGDWMIVLRDGRELMLSRRYRDRLPELAG
ncbi:MAG TPA: LytTR family DNA-binding domain-containing protein [Longimicrobium sp.]|nr:LytTR family DNA-binding domain-containing protein [Longimicrobium sp.]